MVAVLQLDCKRLADNEKIIRENQNLLYTASAKNNQ